MTLAMISKSYFPQVLFFQHASIVFACISDRPSFSRIFTYSLVTRCKVQQIDRNQAVMLFLHSRQSIHYFPIQSSAHLYKKSSVEFLSHTKRILFQYLQSFIIFSALVFVSHHWFHITQYNLLFRAFVFGITQRMCFSNKEVILTNVKRVFAFLSTTLIQPAQNVF